MTETLQDLQEMARGELEDWARENWPVQDSELDDTIHEIADGMVPVYNGDLLDLASQDNWLAVEEPEVMAFDGRNTPINAIAGNVYQAIVDDLWDYWQGTLSEQLDFELNDKEDEDE